MSRQLMVRSAMAALMGTLLLGACGGSDDPKSDGATSTTAAAGGEGSGEDPKVVAVDADDVLAEQTFALARSPKDTVTIGVQSLRVDGDVMELRLVLTPHFASRGDNDVVSVYNILENGVLRPVLVDRENLKEYSVIRDGPFSWSSDPVATEVTNDESMVAFVMYAAPEDDIDTVELRVRDVWPSFTDVPIER